MNGRCALWETRCMENNLTAFFNPRLSPIHHRYGHRSETRPEVDFQRGSKKHRWSFIRNICSECWQKLYSHTNTIWGQGTSHEHTKRPFQRHSTLWINGSRVTADPSSALPLCGLIRLWLISGQSAAGHHSSSRRKLRSFITYLISSRFTFQFKTNLTSRHSRRRGCRATSCFISPDEDVHCDRCIIGRLSSWFGDAPCPQRPASSDS